MHRISEAKKWDQGCRRKTF